jgi:predicted nuclease of predicted toxin-antitoxin system
MWLLDVNMPKRLTSLLKELSIEGVTTQSRGWNTLTNGRLVEAAASAGFSCLLTRDRRFGDSASAALKQFSTFSVVIVTLPQLREQQFLEAFRTAWNNSPILPVPGHRTSWPA